MYSYMKLFNVGVADSNLGSHVYLAGTLPPWAISPAHKYFMVMCGTMHVIIQVYPLCTCAHVEARAKCRLSFPVTLYLIPSRQPLSVNWKLTVMVRPADHRALLIWLLPPCSSRVISMNSPAQEAWDSNSGPQAGRARTQPCIIALAFNFLFIFWDKAYPKTIKWKGKQFWFRQTLEISHRILNTLCSVLLLLTIYIIIICININTFFLFL